MKAKILLNKKIIKGGFYFFKNFKQARDIFIKQAMGRINLTIRVLLPLLGMYLSQNRVNCTNPAEIFGDSRIACLSILLKGASIAKVDKSCKLDVSASTSLSISNFYFKKLLYF